jgi:hypothetical protein
MTVLIAQDLLRQINWTTVIIKWKKDDEQSDSVIIENFS